MTSQKNAAAPKLPRSKKAFYQSFFKLIKSADIEAISVQEILDDSGYSRSSFYQNFSDKYDMISTLMEDEARAYISHCIANLTQIEGEDNDSKLWLEIAKAAFEFVLKEREFYTLLIKNSIPGFDKERFFGLANEYYLLAGKYPVQEHDADMNIQLYISGMTSIFGAFITFWANHDFADPVEYMASQLVHFLYNISANDFMELRDE